MITCYWRQFVIVADTHNGEWSFLVY